MESPAPEPSKDLRAAMRDSIYDQLLTMVLSGKYPPGSRLSVDTLARDLKVSPTPVREALLQLQSTGLVEHVALKGFRVTHPIDRDEIDELFAARAIIETNAAGLAFDHRDELIPKLRAQHANHMSVAAELLSHATDQAVTENPDFIRYFDADWGFHRVIVEATGNRFLADMASKTSTHAVRLRQSVSHGVDDVNQAIAEHSRILSEFTSGDRDSTVKAMQEHIEAVHKRSVADAS